MDGMEELLERIADVVAEKVVERLQGQKATYTVDDLIKRYGKCSAEYAGVRWALWRHALR